MTPLKFKEPKLLYKSLEIGSFILEKSKYDSCIMVIPIKKEAGYYMVFIKKYLNIESNM